jgi:hypothetical protein
VYVLGGGVAGWEWVGSGARKYVWKYVGRIIGYGCVNEGSMCVCLRTAGV